MTLYGMIIAIPTIIVAGPVFARSLKNIHSVPLMALTALPPLMPAMQQDSRPSLVSFLGAPITVMLVFVIVATFTLGIANGRSMNWVAQAA